jgi:hypothetical protein
MFVALWKKWIKETGQNYVNKLQNYLYQEHVLKHNDYQSLKLWDTGLNTLLHEHIK